MGLLVRKDHGEIRLTNIAQLGVIGLLVSIGSSFVVTIWAVYMNSIIHNIAYVGFVSAFLTLIGMASFFIFIPLIERTKKSRMLYFSLFFISLSYISFIFIKDLYMFILAASILTILTTLRISSFGIMVKDKSSNSTLDRNEGLMYTFLNISWTLGPLVAGFIVKIYGINAVFISASIFIILAFLIGTSTRLHDNHIQKKVDDKLMKNFFEFFKNKKRVQAYIIGSGATLWWILIFLYIPLYIVEQGLGEIFIGYFLFAVSLPLIILEYRFSNMTKKHGYRRLFAIGYLIPALAALACFFIVNEFAILGLLVFASIGLAMLEPTTESYFFKISSKHDQQRFYSPFNTRMDVGGFIGKVVPSLIILFLPFKFIFLCFSAMMFMLCFISLRVRH